MSNMPPETAEKIAFGSGAHAGAASREESYDIPLLDMRPKGFARTGSGTPARKDLARLRNASWAFTTRRIPAGTGTAVLPLNGSPEVGDLVLARVDLVGHHSGLQLINGRRRHLFPGDDIVVAYGHRYASSQFEAEVPETFGPCHLVAGGGIASRSKSWHVRITKGPTQITPIGLVGSADGNRLNLRDFGLRPSNTHKDYEPTCIAVVGTSMDSGKTQTCVHLTRGLVSAGLRVGYAKLTGTGAGGDIWWLKDAGADPVVDFTDAGMPSTYLAPMDAIENAAQALLEHVAGHGVDAIVVEIADGVLQRETAALLGSDVIAEKIGGIVLSAQDSMGATAGVSWLEDYTAPVLALSGVLSASPLQVVEATNSTGLPCVDREGLAVPDNALRLLRSAQANSIGSQAKRETA